MKKILSVLGLIAILGITTPVMAAPGGPGHGGHGGPPPGGHRGGHHVVAGHHHHHQHRGHYIRPHGGVVVHTGYPRHSYWRSYGPGYWGSTWCDYRLGFCDDYYYRPYRPLSGLGVSIRF